ncbi:MAG: DNA recombination protein RmuC [Clostridia bacterium]|nr:DNA recombination protein RmuC [Clostridia bacterium]
MLIAISLLLVLVFRKNNNNSSKIESDIAEIARMINNLSARMTDMRQFFGEEMGRNRKETADALKEMNTLIREIQDMNVKQSEKTNKILAEEVQKLQESNEKKLDQMRQTVDEKLNETLTKRLDSSFKTVGDQLNNVYKSLGEMKELATDVNDLQRALTNVKTRGTWAEAQLGNILEQTLTNDQFERNVSIKKDGTVVEFAVKIPSRDKDGEFVLLPIDSKFPQEDYLRICEAADNADKAGVDAAVKNLANVIKNEAQKIAKLYIDVPQTTDFAIMFLATEGLYAEVLRIPGLCEEIQNKHRVMICGPTTVTAFLNTLRMGFRTIAIDKRASEVWKVLGAAKSQYENFGVLLAKAGKKIEEAGNTIGEAAHRNSIIQKKLKGVELLDSGESNDILGLESGLSIDE